MKRTSAIVAALVVAFSALSACSPAPVELVMADNGSTQSLAVGQELTVTLESNPTTGYSWAMDGALPEQLIQLGESEFTAESDLVGSGGAEVWRFRADEAGEGVLKLKYWRSFEPDVAPIEQFTVTVTVP